jgi:hypothetical protein
MPFLETQLLSQSGDGVTDVPCLRTRTVVRLLRD